MKNKHRINQRTVKCIHWLKNYWETKRAWAKALARLTKIDATS